MIKIDQIEVFLIVGFGSLAILTFVNIFWMVRRNKVVDWVATQGKVIDCKVNLVSNRYRGSRIETVYEVTILYHYQADGNWYEGNKFQIDRSLLAFRTQSEADEARRRYKPSRKLTVFYDPYNPTDCTLKKGQRNYKDTITVNLIAGFILLFSAYLVYALASR